MSALRARVTHRLDERVEQVVPVVGDSQEEQSQERLGKGGEGIPTRGSHREINLGVRLVECTRVRERQLQ